MWRKGNRCPLLVGMKNVIAIIENSWSFLKKLKIELSCDPAIPFLGIYLKKTKTLIWKDTCIIYNFQDMEATLMLINKWIDKDVTHTHTHTHTHTLEY